jgi:hypothetical protein
MFICDSSAGLFASTSIGNVIEKILRLAFSESEPPTVVMDDDADVIRVVEGCRAAVERGLVEVPLGRSELPDELRDVEEVQHLLKLIGDAGRPA